MEAGRRRRTARRPVFTAPNTTSPAAAWMTAAGSPPEEPEDPQRHARQVGDQQHADAEDGKEGQDVPVEPRQRLPEARRGEEEVEPDRREQEAELEVGEEDHPEVDRVDAESHAD